MKVADLAEPSVLILGLGREGTETLRFLRAAFPQKPLAVADRCAPENLDAEARGGVLGDPKVRGIWGAEHLAHLTDYEVIIKAPGIPPSLPQIRDAIAGGATLSSHTELFLDSCPGTVVGITGTKGKSTTATLAHRILLAGGIDSHLVGNIGNPPLRLLPAAGADTVFVYELSSHQLEGLHRSPHIAVLLNVVSDHLEYHGSFAAYAAAKGNIARFQRRDDVFIYNADDEIAAGLAGATAARAVAFSLEDRPGPGWFRRDGALLVRGDDGREETVVGVAEVPLAGSFNLRNVLAAMAVGHALGVGREAIAAAVRAFEPLEHRFECVGTFAGVTFYNASLATVPEATIAHLEALGDRVQTILLGGHDRHLDYANLARELLRRGVRNLILFPTTGRRVWEEVEAHRGEMAEPRAFFVEGMEEAVRLAYAHTPAGTVCLHSPAAASFGLFRDYRERGEAFKSWVRRLGETRSEEEG